jgi:hypothetical protein
MLVLGRGLVLGQASKTDDIPPGDNLVVDGIPRIPRSLAQAVSRYRNGYGYPLAGWDATKRELWLKVLASTVTWVTGIEKPRCLPRPLISIPDGGAYDIYVRREVSALGLGYTSGFSIYDQADSVSTLTAVIQAARWELAGRAPVSDQSEMFLARGRRGFGLRE